MSYEYYLVGDNMPLVVKVKDVMDGNIYSLDVGKTCSDAINLMVEKDVWSIIVTDKGSPVGVVTERDIFRRVLAKGMDIDSVKLGDIMSKPLITISPDEPIGKAMELMAVKNIRRVYVVDEGRIVGRVTQTSAFRHILNVLMALHDIGSKL
jgi:predicted transcriptional regulator